jgi:hypothetical protein
MLYACDQRFNIVTENLENFYVNKPSVRTTRERRKTRKYARMARKSERIKTRWLGWFSSWRKKQAASTSSAG